MHLRVGDGPTYSAGQDQIDGLPEWPEDLAVEARLEKTEEYEWRNRTERDVPIDWDVVISPSSPPYTDDPNFYSALLVALGQSESIKVVENTLREGLIATIAIRVEARTEDEARANADALVMEAFYRAMEQFADGPYGWVIGLDPRPAQ